MRKCVKPLVISLLFVSNLWIWNINLPFENYATSPKKAGIIAVVHGLTILAEIMVLLILGKRFSKQKNNNKWFIKNWLGLIFISLVVVVINLISRGNFAFADLISALLPILRDSSPLVISILVATIFLPLIGNLQNETKEKLSFGIQLAFLLAMIFNVDYLGATSSQSLVPYLALLILGASLPERKWLTHREILGTSFVFVTAFLLLFLMPSISLTVHNNWSTANRFAVLTNGFLVVCAVKGLAFIRLPKIDEFAFEDFSFVSSVLFTLPLVQNWLIIFLGSYGSSLLRKLVFAIVISILGMLVSFILLKVMDKVPTNFKFQIPASFTSLRLLIWNFYQSHRQVIFSLVTCYLLSMISFLVVQTSWKFSPNVDATYNTVLYLFAARQGMLILTACFLWLIYRSLLAIIGRYWASIGITSFLILMWAVANRIKIAARNEPIMPGEVKMVDSYENLLNMVPVWGFIVTFILLLVVILGILILEKKCPIKVKQTIWQRVVALIITAMVFGSANYWNHSNALVSKVVAGMGDMPSFFNQLAGVQENGPLIQFLNNLDIRVMNEPRGYNAKTMAKLAKHYKKEANLINEKRQHNLKNQTVIFNLSESFADPNRVPGIKVAGNPIETIKSLKKQNTGGLMLSSGYGGGTANMEYMTLTGLPVANFMPTLSTPYTQLVQFEKSSWAYNQLFRKSVAIHPYVGTFYNRETVYKKFGFNRFMYLGSKYKIKHQKRLDQSPYLSDYTAYENVLDQLRKQQNGQFINLVTMQNHFPYDRNYYRLSTKYQVKVKNATPIDSVKDFVAGTHYTDLAVKQFITKLDQLKQPVTVVFYGDHLPGIYANSFAKDGEKLHETDYFIYSNKVAREQGAKNLTKNTKYVAPNEFMAMVAEQTNSKVTPYLAFLTDAWHNLPAEVMNMTGEQSNSYAPHPQFVTRQGKIISQKHFTKKQK